MFDQVLSPIQIGPKELRNRIFVSAHVPGFAEDGKPGERYIAYQRERAAGGAAMQITGATAVHHSGLLTASPGALVSLDDGIIPGYQRLAKTVHQEGGTMLAQLGHAAGTLSPELLGTSSWGPSPIRSEVTGNVPHEMTSAEIAEVIDAYARAAARAKVGNLDGIEILSAFGFLPHAFLSPLNNQRTDGYGGSLKHRMRFLLELIEACHAAVGEECILGVRIPGSDMVENGLVIEDMQVVAQSLEQSNKVDYLNVIAYNNSQRLGRGLHWPATPANHELFVEFAAQIKAKVNLPVLVAGRIVRPEQAEAIIQSGKADMVAMTRAHITDPELVRKMIEQRPEDIRPCVGANTCIRARLQGRTVRCMHHVFSERKSVALHQRKKIIVVGAGPAGLEAALIAAQSGHDVQIFEAQDQCGGQLALWGSVQSQRELMEIVHWRVRQLEKLSVPLNLNSEVTENDLELFKDAVIIVATGAQSSSMKADGDGSVPQTTPEQLLRRKEQYIGSAIVVDEGHGMQAFCAAEYLLGCGMSVTVVTDKPAVGMDLDMTVQAPAYQRLLGAGVDFVANQTVTGIKSGDVYLQNVYSSKETLVETISVLVDNFQMNSKNQLAEHLSKMSTIHYAIGDCVSPRNVEAAIQEATRVLECV